MNKSWYDMHPPSTRHGGRPKIPIPIGFKVGRLTVIAEAPALNRRSRSVCLCECGNITVKPNIVLRGKCATLSCGCLLSDSHLKHGGKKRRTRNRMYNIWSGMKRRCYNKKSAIYKFYGARGISVCDEWRNSFASFREWCEANGYSDAKSIDRINPDGNYEPNNCRFATRTEQAYNKRNTIYITIDGCKKNLKEWCDLFGTPNKLARTRVNDGKEGIDVFLPPYPKKGVRHD